MRKKREKQIKKNNESQSEYVLPIEQWLIPSLHFSHVRGIARIFLLSEIFLSCAVVLGSIVLLGLRILYSK